MAAHVQRYKKASEYEVNNVSINSFDITGGNITVLLLLEKDHKDLLFKATMIQHDIINALQTSHQHKLVLASYVTVTIHLSPPWSLGR